jgi:hypothetical protein
MSPIDPILTGRQYDADEAVSSETVPDERPISQHHARAGAAPMRRPGKQALYSHIARADVALAEAAELLGSQRDLLEQQFAGAVEQGYAKAAFDLAEQVRVVRKSLAYLRLAVSPDEWRAYLPAVQLDDSMEEEQ